MLFYHYSTEQYAELKSLSAQQGSMPKTIRMYGNSISLFIEPLPLIVADIFRQEHSIYRSHKEFYEHVLDSNDLPLNIDWHITETPEKVDLLYNKQKWYEGMSEDEIRSNKLEIVEMENKQRYNGVGRLSLVKRLKESRFFSSKSMEQYFKEAQHLNANNPEDKILEKYAACVPHVMIYPCMKPIEVKSSKLIELI